MHPRRRLSFSIEVKSEQQHGPPPPTASKLRFCMFYTRTCDTYPISRAMRVGACCDLASEGYMCLDILPTVETGNCPYTAQFFSRLMYPLICSGRLRYCACCGLPRLQRSPSTRPKNHAPPVNVTFDLERPFFACLMYPLICRDVSAYLQWVSSMLCLLWFTSPPTIAVYTTEE